MKKSYLLIAIALIATLILGACGTKTDTPVVDVPEDVETPVTADGEVAGTSVSGLTNAPPP